MSTLCVTARRTRSPAPRPMQGRLGREMTAGLFDLHTIIGLATHNLDLIMGNRAIHVLT